MNPIIKVVLFWPVALAGGFALVALASAVSDRTERRARRRPPLTWGR